MDMNEDDMGGILYTWAPEDFNEDDYDIDEIPKPDWDDDDDDDNGGEDYIKIGVCIYGVIFYHRALA
ncbi:hypothetical protein BGZ96_000890 [Linnemannia gamsii]|uniref:Uncharacterized protein n=1 Tax=Linnemannia gamsii TaxID=64522 RepID=A0ABQ7JNK5_9FUNG|nr:hypothetical protein BGZ96_000890 [Linnemannia gamsii]